MTSKSNKKEIAMFSVLALIIVAFLAFFVVTIKYETAGMLNKDLSVTSSENSSKNKQNEIETGLFDNKKFEELKKNSHEEREFKEGKKNPFKSFKEQ